MAISINWLTRVIFIPKSFMTIVSATLYELDVNLFRIALKDIEDSPDGMAQPDTHRHNSPVTLAGTTYARSMEIINGFTVEFEDGQYAVRCIGANHNIGDVKVLNQVSLIIGNAAGLIVYVNNVSGGVGTVDEVKAAVWSATNLSAYGAGTAGEKLDSVGASANPWLTDLSSYNTAGTAGKVLKDAQTSALAAQNNTDTLESAVAALPTATDISDAVRVELTPELSHIMQLPTGGSNGLTPSQATMLLEMYELLGLDPTKPLVVTKTGRFAGTISQSINTNTEQTTVTRL
jgi:hypothetical protein